MKRQRDERLKAARLVLQLAQPAEVIDAVPGLLDVAVEHRGVGAQAELVRLAVDAEPLGGVGLVLADLIADFGMKNLRAAAGQTAQARVLELGEKVARRPAGQPGEPVPFHRRVRLEVQPRMRLVDDADDVQIPFVRQLMVQTADDVQLGGAAALGLGGALQDLLVGHDVALFAAQVGAESAEGAAVDADVGRIEVRVDVVIGEIAVLALADDVGQFAEREQVGALVKENAVVEGQPLAGLDFFADDGQTGVGS